MKALVVIGPRGYPGLHSRTAAAFVQTDSGRLQEETTTPDVPCVTLSERTERPAHDHRRHEPPHTLEAPRHAAA